MVWNKNGFGEFPIRLKCFCLLASEDTTLKFVRNRTVERSFVFHSHLKFQVLHTKNDSNKLNGNQPIKFNISIFTKDPFILNSKKIVQCNVQTLCHPDGSRFLTERVKVFNGFNVDLRGLIE